MLILVRHGQSEWNLANRFTGWWDVALTEQGIAEASAAGALMRDKGVLPTIAFTSLQTRAIKTLHLALEACGRLWIPETKDWHLNERHYGGLTGLDKQETRERHGDEQVLVWRRSFDVPLLANMVEGGRTPVASTEALGTLGFKIVIFPGGLVRALAMTAQAYFASLKSNGSNENFRNRMFDFQGLQSLLGTDAMLERGRRYDGDA